MSLFMTPRALLRRYQDKKAGSQATAHQGAAIAAWEELGDTKRYLPVYLSLFKRAGGLVDLSDLVALAKGKREPGRYFLEAARVRLGISKKKKLSTGYQKRNGILPT